MYIIANHSAMQPKKAEYIILLKTGDRFDKKKTLLNFFYEIVLGM